MFSHRSSVSNSCSMTAALSLSAVAAFAIVGLTTCARASTLLNFQIMGAPGNTSIVEQTGAAAIGTSGNSWNYLYDNTNGDDGNGWTTLTSVVDSEGNSISGISAAFQANHWQPSTTSGDVPILSNAGYQGGGVTPLLTISGLAPGTEYDLVAYVGFSLYAFGNNSITANGTSIGTLNADNVTTLVNGTNYLETTVSANSSGIIAIGASNALSGVQLQVVPIPGTMDLVAIGGLGLLLLKRRKTV